MIDISKLKKEDVLAALYNNSKPQGMGFLHFTPEDMTSSQAAEHLQNGKNFDYLHGRIMKVNLSGDEFNERLYDRDNGEGAAEMTLETLR